MIRSQWYAVLDAREVGPGGVVGTTRMGEKLAFWRDASGKVGCVADRCIHRGASLGMGKVLGEHLQCPFHGFEYDASGQVRVIPANSRSAEVPETFRTRAYPVCDSHGIIWLWWGDPRDALPELPFFPDLDRSFAYATAASHWPVHYSRVIENQLDVVHLPFVHRNTIGRGGRTVVDGPQVAWEGDELRVWVHNRVDDGRPPIRAEELGVPSGPARLFLRMPNVWQNRLTDDARIVALFAPIDDANTMLYLRLYRRFARGPIVGPLVGWLSNLANGLVAGQDRRVVATQRPLRSDLRMDERLIAGDRPIIEYRRRRSALQEQGEGA